MEAPIVSSEHRLARRSRIDQLDPAGEDVPAIEQTHADESSVIPITGEGVLREHALVWRTTAPSRNLFKEIAERIKRIIRTDLADVTVPAI